VRQRAFDRSSAVSICEGNTFTPRMMNMSSLRRPMRDAAQGAAAGQGPASSGDVARAVADHRHRLLAERRQHQFALSPSGIGSAVSGSMTSG
jgi:hypothetical protein